MSERKKRKRWSAEDNMALRHVATLCRSLASHGPITTQLDRRLPRRT